ncbi:MAG: divergent polysaccharide deacetylase family protein [Alphaproteobacteria bacterium]
MSRSLMGAWIFFVLLICGMVGWGYFASPPKLDIAATPYFEAKLEAPSEAVSLDASENIVLEQSASVRDTPLDEGIFPVAVTERTAKGPLPRISDGGQAIWQVHQSKSVEIDAEKPQLAIVFNGLGFDQETLKSVIDDFPAGVTLAVQPFAPYLQNIIKDARQAGHEVLLIAPMEPNNFPTDDPGPYTLLTGLDGEDNLDRLHWVLSQAGGYVGITNGMGERFLSSPEDAKVVFQECSKRGIGLVEVDRSFRSKGKELAGDTKAPYCRISQEVSLQDDDTLDEQLGVVLSYVKLKMQAGVSIDVTPGVLNKIAEWMKKAQEEGVQFVPISTLISPDGQGS